nr:type III-B CRISPR module-associated protein Cmr5 [Caenibacillus caldisaponilyticus]
MAEQRVGIENGRAAFAFKSVKDVYNHHGDVFDNYQSYVKKMPSLIQVNGFGQALAFCYQKGKEYRYIYDQLAEWLKLKYPSYFVDRDAEFVETVVSLRSTEYRLLTVEALALLNWMRKFVDGMRKED